MKVFAMLLLALVMGGQVSPANADPVNNTRPDLYVSRIVPETGGLIVTLSNGHFDYLKPCRYEDGRSCYWNAETRGNGKGRSFVVLAGRRFFVNLRGL